MKKLIVITLIGVIISGSNFLKAQSVQSYSGEKMISIDGSEKSANVNNPEIIIAKSNDPIYPVFGDYYTYNFHNITDRKTGYDLQSNACPQQVWFDLNYYYLHAIFMNSQETTGWADRTCLYFGSTDNGNVWYELGPVPVTTRSGFPAIYGNSIGAAVVSNHNAVFTTTHTTILIDTSPFEFNFVNYDPGTLPEAAPIWPRLTVLNDQVTFACAQNGPDSFFVNTLDPSVPSFLGYHGIDGEQAEQYSLAVSDGGKIGLAYNGQDAPADNSGDVFYIESTDGGMTWTDPPITVWERNHSLDTTLGAIRGVNVSFYGEEPCVVFETCMQIFTLGTFFPNLPSEIMFWSPNVNGGMAYVIADSNNVPYYPYQGTNDVYAPLCRPVIARSETGNLLFVAFSATTENVFPSPDTTTYVAGYFMSSGNGGNSWTTPEKFTPESPLKDWRYPSIAPINPVDNEMCTVHMVIQGDSIPGSTINADGMPVGVTAQYYHVSTSPIVIPVELFSFTAERIESNVILNWQTATETNNLGFEIQRKTIDKDVEAKWEVIGFEEGKGTTTDPQAYNYNDDISEIAATSFEYRLRQIDLDGSYQYSNVVRIDNSQIADDFILYQNYPNPFNPVTRIKYTIPKSSLVTIKVYDLIGNELVTLTNEEKESGKYTLELDAGKLHFSSGVYFYQLRTGDFVETKKMILIK